MPGGIARVQWSLIAHAGRSRTTLVLLALVATLAVTSSCGDGRDRSTAVASVQATADIELEQPGAEPHRQLGFRAGKVARNITLELAWRAGNGGAQATQSHQLDMSWRGDAGFRRRFEILDVRAGPIEQASAAERRAIERAASQLVGGRGFVDGHAEGLKRAVQESGKLTRPELPWLLYILSVPLPDAPVGNGATWQSTLDFALADTHVSMSRDYQLVEWRGDAAIVKLVGRITSRTPKATPPELTIEATGRLEMPPSALLPMTANLRLRYLSGAAPTLVLDITLTSEEAAPAAKRTMSQ